MDSSKLITCPVCGNEMELGFSGRSSPLSWISSEKMKKFVFRDEDLNRAGWRMVLPAKARYNLAHHCRACKILIVDYSRKIPSREAKAQAALRAPPKSRIQGTRRWRLGLHARRHGRRVADPGRSA